MVVNYAIEPNRIHFDKVLDKVEIKCHTEQTMLNLRGKKVRIETRNHVIRDRSVFSNSKDVYPTFPISSRGRPRKLSWQIPLVFFLRRRRSFLGSRVPFPVPSSIRTPGDRARRIGKNHGLAI